MSSAVAGYKATLGMDAPPACYEDIDHAQCLFIAGSNTAFAHPILYRRIEAARQKNPQLKTIVVDPRRTDTAREAHLHLAILPGTDVALYNGMLHVLLWEELCDLAYISAHTEGFDALKQTVREYTPAAVARRTCGVPVDAIVEAARWFGQSKATLSLYCQGLNQSSNGTQNNAALIKAVAEELHLDWNTVKDAGEAVHAEQLRPRRARPGPTVIGIDEISIRKGHTYRIVVSDLLRRRPIWFGGTDRSESEHGRVLQLARANEERAACAWR